MISCIILAIAFLYLAWATGYFTGKPRGNKDFLTGFSAGLAIAVLVFGITVICTSRTYDTERFSVSYPASECQIKESKGRTTIIHGSDSYSLPTAAVVVYDAADKASEQVEISGERRLYKRPIVDDVYMMYYLRKPYDETTTLTFNVNRSIYKPE